MEWTRKHQNLSSASDNDKRLACEKKSNANEDCNSFQIF